MNAGVKDAPDIRPVAEFGEDGWSEKGLPGNSPFEFNRLKEDALWAMYVVRVVDFSSARRGCCGLL